MATAEKPEQTPNNNTRKMRATLDGSFSDPLQAFTTPIRAIQDLEDPELLEEHVMLTERTRRMFVTSAEEEVGFDTSKIEKLVDERGATNEAYGSHIRHIRTHCRNWIANNPPGDSTKRAKEGLKAADAMEKACKIDKNMLAVDRQRLKNDVFSQPAKKKFPEAYLMALTERMPEPADAAYKSKGRSSIDQSSFRNRLIKEYNVNPDEIFDTPKEVRRIWCPISGKLVPSDSMKAAHIVPYAIGDPAAAYIFGAEPSEGYEILWSTRNGMMMHKTLEDLFDSGRITIIPDPTDANEFISVIISQSLLEQKLPFEAIDAPFCTLHKRRLQFQTQARPAKRYLYLHLLITMFRRKRFGVPGWELDQERYCTGQIWASPGNWVRESMIGALAVVVGDGWEGMEQVEGLGRFPGAHSSAEEKKMATSVGHEYERRARKAEEDEEEEDDVDE